ncbi:glycogen debranching N-terminal domain-containing protein [Salinispira pacifica]|uniref:Glycogen debranching enzyme n=1 Tax=Salinispira pacifica TaxID=1307761 RepID=V5WNF6_9SPIO|nr:glycogen debranching N-terminal domain-containing protein [Salinispira pacifica]AHC16516.1 Glycogen debranching enzyme [Salinispira pacifica]
MDLSRNIVLKENYTFLVTDADGNINTGEQGLYSHDTRFLRHMIWSFSEPESRKEFQTLVAHSSRPDQGVFHYSLIEGPSQILGVQRRLYLREGTLSDRFTLENTDTQPRQLELTLSLGADFLDLFEARGFYGEKRDLSSPEFDKGHITFQYSDPGNEYLTRIEWFCEPDSAPEVSAEKQEDGVLEAVLRWQVNLEPGRSRVLELKIDLTHPCMKKAETPPLPSYDDWRKEFLPAASLLKYGQDRVVLEQAVQDLRALMLSSEQGDIPAAGIPWFVAAFGRDSLLTAYMLLPHHSWVARGVLEYLGYYQGTEHNDFRGEEPGKIMHEIRFGELAQKELVPHNPYYGTIDATPLYIILLEKLWEYTGDDSLLKTFRPNWEACLDWMLEHGDRDNDGFLEYISAEPGKGLVVQSWKDSDDSMSHSDGTLASGYIRPAEVQGYAYRAFSAASKFYHELGMEAEADTYTRKAEELQKRFDAAFWNDEMKCYAMALDGEHKPLMVKSSNAGQLFWSGIVSGHRAAELAATIMSSELYSGWGIRTLGTGEMRYNPVSYHNGSVWPHDTALIAKGLWNYGYRREAGQLVRDLFDLASSQSDKRLPELIAGYPRGSSPPVPYPVACRPQAWDAAALVYLQPLLARDSEE